MKIEKEYPLVFGKDKKFGLDITIVRHKRINATISKGVNPAINKMKKLLKKQGVEYEEYHGPLHIINPEFYNEHWGFSHTEAVRFIVRERKKVKAKFIKKKNFVAKDRRGNPLNPNIYK